MKEKIRKIHRELNDGRITVSQATEQVLDLLAVRHRFLIRFDFSSKSVQKLANLCKKYPPKIIIIDNERKINNTLGIKYYLPTNFIELVY